MYEYQRLAFMHGRIRRQRDLKHWFILQLRDILPHLKRRSVVSRQQTHPPSCPCRLPRGVHVLLRQRKTRIHYIRKKSQGKVRRKYQLNTGLVIISLCARKCYSLLRCLSQKAGTKERVIARCSTLTSSIPRPTILTSNLTRPRSPLTTHGLAVVLFFLSSSLNYWKQNGLRTKTQADVG